MLRIYFLVFLSSLSIPVLFDMDADFHLVDDKFSTQGTIQEDDSTIYGNWPEEFREVEIVNPNDNVVQHAYFRPSQRKEPQPLVVVLHTWSGDYTQDSNSLAREAETRDWNYIHPDFRGPNRKPEACCSERVIEDIDFAIDYALANSRVDPDRIFVTGASGGGYAALCHFMRSRHKVSSYAAWVPITDLEAWYRESQTRESRYARDIIACTGSVDSLDVMEARRRSPMFMPVPLEKIKTTRIGIYAGIRDGYEGSVPITHSLWFYNRLLRVMAVPEPSAFVTPEEAQYLVTARKGPIPPGLKIGGRKIEYFKEYGSIRLVIFDGAHEMIPEVALEVLQP